tara:strand:+ start:334 stop:582 length:249 start_codon:yes stop_codon:yes gene_type:complete
MKTTEIEIEKAILEVEYKFHKGEPPVYYYADGSGYPGSNDEVEVTAVTWTAEDGEGVDVTDLIDGLNLLETIAEKILENENS